MTVCLDTNTLVQARVLNHAYNPILESLLYGQMLWAISNRTLTEYEEVVVRSAGVREWRRMMRLIELTSAIAAHADYVITSDKHFAPLANAGYKPQPITPEEFIIRYRGVYV